MGFPRLDLGETPFIGGAWQELKDIVLYQIPPNVGGKGGPNFRFLGYCLRSPGHSEDSGGRGELRQKPGNDRLPLIGEKAINGPTA